MYQWRRFWCPRDGHYSLSEEGYLSENLGLARFYISEFESIEHFLCLGLIGEPGIGKTTAIESERKSLETRIVQEKSRDVVLSFDLAAFGNEIRLIAKIFRSQEIFEWINGDYTLHLFLDSLDECMLNIPSISKILIQQLEEIVHCFPRLRLRVACRTSLWPRVLESDLPKLAGKDKFGVYELLPLRKQDVMEAAKSEEVDSDKFIAAIEYAEVVPLAIKPITLRMLFAVNDESGELPRSKIELYKRGCSLLCQENNPNRQDLRAAGGIGTLSIDQRMMLASRIAAISVYCAKFTIIYDPLQYSSSEKSEINLSELSNRKEFYHGSEFDLTDNAVLEVLGSGLFNSRGHGKIGFAHQSYAEYLAASYLMESGIDFKQAMRIFVSADYGLENVIPQLAETAAWAASMEHALIEKLTQVSPYVLLLSDASSLTDTDKSGIVQSLFQATEIEETAFMEPSTLRHYQKLYHSGLAEQLLPMLHDSGKPAKLRLIAKDIVEECNLVELCEPLCEIINDVSEDYLFRHQIASILPSFQEHFSFQQFTHLLSPENTEEDCNDDVRGYILAAFWPKNISSEYLFSILTPPQNPSHIGSYQLFLEYQLSENLTLEHLPHAIIWLSSYLHNPGIHRLTKLVSRILFLAWKHIYKPGIISKVFLLWRAPRTYLNDYINACIRLNPDSNIFACIERKHHFIEYVVNNAAEAGRLAIQDLWFYYPKISKEDLIWVIEKLHDSQDPSQRRHWARLAGSLISARTKDSHLTAIMESVQEHAEVRDELQFTIGPILLNSDYADDCRNRYKNYWQEDEDQSEKTVHPVFIQPSAFIEIVLKEIEYGEIKKWPSLLKLMTIQPKSEGFGNRFTQDITQLPGWLIIEKLGIVERIIEAAKSYIEKGTLIDSYAIFNGETSQVHFSALQAFALIKRKDPGFLTSLSKKIWVNWLPIFFIPWFAVTGRDDRISFMKRIHSISPSDFHRVLYESISASSNYIRSLPMEFIEEFWDSEVAELILDLLRRDEKPELFSELLGVLLSHKVQEAEEIAFTALALSQSSSEQDIVQAVDAAFALINESQLDWSIVWNAVQQNKSFAEKLLMSLSVKYYIFLGDVCRHMNEDQISELYLSLTSVFSQVDELGNYKIRGRIDIRSIDYFKPKVLSCLKVRGTPEAYKSLRNLKKLLPDDADITWALRGARRSLIEKSWIPLSLSEFIQLTQTPESTLVQSAQHLLCLLEEALDKLEIKLQAENPAASDLWDEQHVKNQKVSSFIPKDENHLTDYVNRYLMEDLSKRGIVALTEVIIRRGEGSGQGEQTDIHVTGNVFNPRNQSTKQVRVIIEVKCCWNQNLKTDMKNQLVDRYLADNDCNHGLYLIGWYHCPQWDPEDYKAKRLKSLSIEDARIDFTKQAQELSSKETVVRAKVINTALR